LSAAAAGGDVGSAALAGALSEIANAALQEALKADPNLTEEQKSAITQCIAVAVGAAAGGQGGAAAALDNVNYNYLTHAERKEFEKVLAACGMGDASSCDRVDELRDLSAARDQQLDNCVGQTSSSCVKARTDLRVAAATYLDAALSGGGDDLDELSLLERHMVFLSVWKYADSADDTSSQDLANFAVTLKNEQARALLTRTKEEIAKIVRDPIMLSVILYGGHGNAKSAWVVRAQEMLERAQRLETYLPTYRCFLKGRIGRS
jgi:filamentous hemagglutinin